MSILGNWAQHGIARMNRRCHMMPSCCARITSRKHKVSLTERIWGSVRVYVTSKTSRETFQFSRTVQYLSWKKDTMFSLYSSWGSIYLVTHFLIVSCLRKRFWSRCLNGFSFQEVIYYRPVMTKRTSGKSLCEKHDSLLSTFIIYLIKRGLLSYGWLIKEMNVCKGVTSCAA